MEDEHDSVGPIAGAADKKDTTIGEDAKVGDASTGTVSLGAYLNGPLSACKTPCTDKEIPNIHTDESGIMSGEVSSVLICTHAGVPKLTKNVGACAKVRSYTIGGGPHENTLCTSLEGKYVAAEKNSHLAFLTPISTVREGNADEYTTHNIHNTGSGTASVADLVDADKMTEVTKVVGDILHAAGKTIDGEKGAIPRQKL